MRQFILYTILAGFLGYCASPQAVAATVTTANTPPPGGEGTTAPPSSGAAALSSGAPRNFTLPAVNDPTLFSSDSGFKIDVPQGAARLEVKLASTTPNVDLDLFVRYGQDPVVSNGRVTTDYASDGPTATESVVVTASSNPPLRAGTYYIAIASFTTGVRIDATITATVRTGSAPPPPSSGGNVLTSGQPQNFTLAPVTQATIYLGADEYRIDVPQGATSLDVVVHPTTPNAAVFLFGRYNQPIAMVNTLLYSDFASPRRGGDERITIDSTSDPPLRPGTYYFSLGLFTPNKQVTGTITATVNTGSAPPPAAGGGIVLTSNRPRTLFYNPVSEPTFFNGNQSFVIDVPANATRLDIQAAIETAGADVDMFVSYGKDNGIASDGFVADYGSTTPGGNERVIITPQSNPPLRPGRYYISLAIYTTGTNISGTLTATVSTGVDQIPTPGQVTELTPGQPARFSLPTVDDPTLFNGEYSYRIQVPAEPTLMLVQVISDDPTIDVDLFGRYGSDVELDDDGNLIADYDSESVTGNETITITRQSSPPLRPGVYYFSLGVYPSARMASGRIVVSFSAGSAPTPGTSGVALTSGVAATYSLPATGSPQLFAGSSAYRISVDKRHTSLRVTARDNAPGSRVALFVRRGQQPEVVNGRMVADFSVAADDSQQELVLDGANLKPGVYYIALGRYSSDAAAGTITAILTAADGATEELQAGVAAGLRIDPKPAAEVRYPLPDVQSLQEHTGRLVKHTDALKKRQRMRVR